ncbi:MAG: hypothetical protein HYX28_06495 [Candidatus Koribacter versatilis]|uniref:Uncharacterized protein n=1 Tax=Candidatus Korobacter versatilis TaxID=658062 RepID=A0A932A8H2_9BACT|nr:hypothetical protein [Candidatus Koribacter versatilis]
MTTWLKQIALAALLVAAILLAFTVPSMREAVLAPRADEECARIKLGSTREFVAKSSNYPVPPDQILLGPKQLIIVRQERTCMVEFDPLTLLVTRTESTYSGLSR